MESDIMTLEEVAAYLKLKPQTVYTWAQEKKMPAVKLGKEWRFKKSVLDAWIIQTRNEEFEKVLNDRKQGIQKQKEK